MIHPRLLRRAPLLLGTLLLLLVAACDSNDPIADPAEVAGTYTMQELRYVPDNTSLGAINLLSTRFTGPVTLELLSGGAYTLRYTRQGQQAEQLLSGTFTVREDEVRFSGRSSDEDEYERFLLDESFRLDRATNSLSASIDRTVNTSAYPDFYTGVGEVQGEVRIRLTR